MSQQPNRWFVVAAAVALLSLFVGLRLWRLHESLFFYGDLGRDFMVLENWIETGKPPLLGPQTSALPFNQSAWYFYLLLPGYLLAKADVANTVYSSLVLHVAVMAGVSWLLWQRRSALFWPTWLAAAILAVHPEMVLQQRTVWNPSLVAVFLLAGVVLSLLWRESKQTSAHTVRSWFAYEHWLPWADGWMLRLASLCLALAIGFSYSAAPAVLLWLGLLSYQHKQWWRWWLNVGVSLGVVFAPMAIFELRHGFPLTKMMLFQEKLAQQGTAWSAKLSSLSSFVVAGGYSWATGLIVLSVVGLVGLAVWFWCSQVGVVGKRWQAWQLVALWWGLLLISYLVLPVGIQAHYIFPLVTASAVLVALLPSRWRLLIAGIWMVVWLLPVQWQRYGKPPPRSIETSWNCARAVCATVREPLFVSVQAGAYPYHNGIEFQYLLHESGCDVKSLDTQNDQAKVMAVFVEDSVYEHNQTAYNELTQFGASTEEQIIHCSPKLQVHVLRRK